MNRAIPMIGVLVLMAACSQHAAQTTSGAEYLAGYKPIKTTAQPVVQRTVRRTKDGADVIEDRIETVSTDELIRHAAAVEPLLQIPARIGLARIEHGRLTTIPDGESQLWTALAGRHAALGSFAAIDPFLADYTVRTVLPKDRRALRRDASDIITKIRLGAARQHMDAVLIYEVGSRRRLGDEVPGLSPISVLGAAPLAGRVIETEGVARAFLMDVRNGYPYGVASASADLSAFEDSLWDDRPRDAQGIAAKIKITEALLPQVEAMFGELSRQMQVKLAAAQ